MIKVSVTPELACNYIEGEQEQLLVVREKQLLNAAGYDVLLHNGFRRSGDDVYRPHCPNCQACQSLRIDVAKFKPSKSQKRLLNKNKDLTVICSDQPKDSYYPLYAHYINTLHSDGAMYPATQEQYQGFIISNWLTPVFIEVYEQDTLIAVAVTDKLETSLSAMYCFYHPEYSQRSLGTFAILKQLEFAKLWHKHWLYLGFQIDACNKMNYKANFHPHQRFIAENWRS